MANKQLFKSIVGRQAPAANTVNEAGGRAYCFSPKHTLAQYAATGCMNSTFYASAAEQLDRVLSLSGEIEPDFIAKTALYCRERGHMKDMPALLCAILAVRAPGLLPRVFHRVIDNGRMLRNFVQIIRSGVTGRKSLGSLPKRLVREWLEKHGEAALFAASVGQDPSLADILKMVHPKPASPEREALYGYLIGREVDNNNLPAIVRDYEDFKSGRTIIVPDVPFQMLTSLDIGKAEWIEIAKNASWQMTRMNLNTFARHGVFEEPGMAALIAGRIRDEKLIAKARVFPYQLLIAYVTASQGQTQASKGSTGNGNTLVQRLQALFSGMTLQPAQAPVTQGSTVPVCVTEALQDAMEIAINNVPKIDGKVYVFPDVSGSMSCPATGYREGSTSAVRCVDIAGLVAAAVLRKNPEAEVIPFEEDVVNIHLNPRDSVMTNANKLASIGGGGTNCSAPLALLNQRKARGDLIVYVSDNESWVDGRERGGREHGGRGTATLQEWSAFKHRNPKARMVCIDIQPYGSTQTAEDADILNVGGFSDAVFDVIAQFATGGINPDHWIGVIEAIEI